jgi:hypothetical protein
VTVKTLAGTLFQTATQRLVAESQPEQIQLFGSHAWDTELDLLWQQEYS